MNKMVFLNGELYLVLTVDQYVLDWHKELTVGDWGKEFFYNRKAWPSLTMVNDNHTIVTVYNDGPVSVNEHYARLNTYPCIPVVGERWEIDEEMFYHFLEVLPPLKMQGGAFWMSEFAAGNITSKYSQEGERYFHEFVEVERGAKARFEKEYYG